MKCRIIELKDKQVVSLKDGAVIGFINDIEFDTESGKITSVIVSGKQKGIGIFAKVEEYIIPFENIEIVGNDSVLVNYEILKNLVTTKRKGIFNNIFYGE